MENHTAKHFALQLGSLASLYLSVSFFIVLVLALINILFPSAADSIWEADSAAQSVRIGLAMVLVFFPTYLFLTRTVNKNRRISNDSNYLSLTKWLIYLSLLIGGAVLLGDLVAIIMSFLEGDLTVRFMLKALAVFIVTGLAFYYYLLDAKGHWITHEKQSKIYALVVLVIVVATLVFSLSHIQPPSEVREIKIDNQVVGELQDMQWRIEDYYRSKESLPENLEILYAGFTVPTAPEGRSEYTYEIMGDKGYKICGSFAQASTNTYNVVERPVLEKNYNWDYQAGDWCFERVIDDTYRQ